jgi:hypothetical protein
MKGEEECFMVVFKEDANLNLAEISDSLPIVIPFGSSQAGNPTISPADSKC